MANIKLKGNLIHTNGELPQVGSQAPDFMLVNQELENQSLQNFQTKKKLLSILPSLDTSTCSLMAKKFNEAIKDHPEVVTLVISADLPFAQKRFCGQENTHNIITLSMMRNQDFARDYGVLIQDGPLAGICARAVVVLDESNKVLYAQMAEEISEEPNYEEALSHLLRQ